MGMTVLSEGPSRNPTVKIMAVWLSKSPALEKVKGVNLMGSYAVGAVPLRSGFHFFLTYSNAAFNFPFLLVSII